MNTSERLGRSMTILSTLVRLEVPFPEVLERVTLLAAQAVSDADGGWVIWSPPGQVATVAASRGGLRGLDRCQYQLDEGPSLAAYDEQRVVLSGGLGADPRWPRFAERGVAEQVCSVLAAPMTVQATRLGVLTVCSDLGQAFDEDSAADIALFAEHTAHTLMNAHALASAETKAEQLNEAIVSRAVIEQAKGIVMSKEGCSAAEAFDRLRAASQNGHVKLRDVARLVVDSVATEPPNRARNGSNRRLSAQPREIDSPVTG